jgi:hypothetical protein
MASCQAGNGHPTDSPDGQSVDFAGERRGLAIWHPLHRLQAAILSLHSLGDDHEIPYIGNLDADERAEWRRSDRCLLPYGNPLQPLTAPPAESPLQIRETWKGELAAIFSFLT